jgi:hypothetical protein
MVFDVLHWCRFLLRNQGIKNFFSIIQKVGKNGGNFPLIYFLMINNTRNVLVAFSPNSKFIGFKIGLFQLLKV